MESFVLGVLFVIEGFMKNHYVWGDITIWEASVGFFTIEGIYSAFRLGMVLKRDFYD